MPSVLIGLLLRYLIPSSVIFHGGSSKHRLKHLEKKFGDRGVFVSLVALTSENVKTLQLETPSFKYLIQLMGTPSHVNAVHNIISKLEDTFSESLHIQDMSEHASEGDHNGNCDVEQGNLCGCFEPQETKLEIKYLKDCSPFPYPDMLLPSSSSDEEAATSVSKQSPRQNYSCSRSSPAAPKLVSALKGSREKEGGTQMKLTVKWAPDVYDPVPTLLSHTVKSKKQQKSRIKKKYGKKGQKVNYSKRGSNKDKQYPNKWLHSHEEMFEASTELDDVNVANHDSYCGTSYLKSSSITKVHWPIGEAL